jgi:hypothetical protein
MHLAATVSVKDTNRLMSKASYTLEQPISKETFRHVRQSHPSTQHRSHSQCA